jgi:hypothetical protein
VIEVCCCVACLLVDDIDESYTVSNRCGHCGVGGVLLLRFLNRRAVVLQVHAPVLNTISQGGSGGFLNRSHAFFALFTFAPITLTA